MSRAECTLARLKELPVLANPRRCRVRCSCPATVDAAGQYGSPSFPVRGTRGAPDPRARLALHPRRYLTLLERRTFVACASIGRLLADPGSNALDYTSEGDHIRHTIAGILPHTYRHRAG